MTGMRAEETIAAALHVLGQTDWNSERPATVVVLPPDAKGFINGNRDGFVQLAMAALRAAGGERQPFRGKPWVVIEDWDWVVRGMQYDESAHIYLPPVTSRWKRALRSVVGVLLPLLLIVLFTVGVVVSVRWLLHQFF